HVLLKREIVGLLRRLIGLEQVGAGLAQTSVAVELDDLEGADRASFGIEAAGGGGFDLGCSGRDCERPALPVEYGIAVAGHDPTRSVELKTSVARIARAVGRIDDEKS